MRGEKRKKDSTLGRQCERRCSLAKAFFKKRWRKSVSREIKSEKG